MNENAFFKVTDPKAKRIAGFDLPVGWWSRPWEYSWALKYNVLGGYVANMGAGYTYRPLTDALAVHAGLVYSVDAKKSSVETLRDHPLPENAQFVLADMSKQILAIPPQSLDRIFCVSVIEEVPGRTDELLKEFARLISFSGLIVLTFDVQYDDNKPLGQWQGAHIESVLAACEKYDLTFREDIHMDKEDAVFNEEFNLACFHCVVQKK